MVNIHGSDIIKSISKAKRNRISGGQRKLARIANMFIDRIKEEILKGNEIELPGKMGVLVIEKKVQDKLAPISRIATLKSGKATNAFDPRTMGYYYQIKMNSEGLAHSGIVFKAGSDLRKKLRKNVIEGFKDYKLV